MKPTKWTLLLMLISLSACVIDQIPEPPSVDIPARELNTKIAVSALEGWNDFEIGDPITLSITNISEGPIIFDPYYGARIFVYSGGKWEETSNQLISLHTSEIVMDPVKVNPISTGTTSILPILPTDARSYNLRIYIIGRVHVIENGKDEQVGSFIDLVLK